jgi:uncharacterized membrane protein
MPALVFIVLMVIVYFVVPIAFSSVHVTLLQAAAITLLTLLARIVLTEGITVKIDGIEFEREDE